jgi:hypothetical protein
MNTLALHSLRVLLLAAIACADPADPADKEVPDDTGSPSDSGDTAGSDPDCQDPVSLLLNSGEPSGYEQCADGAVNRVSAENFGRDWDVDACRGDEGDFSCRADEDCTARPNGICASQLNIWDTGVDPSYCGCVYPCESDNDCKENEACHPPEVGDETTPWPECVGANCRTNDDCESGECGYGEHHNGCYWQQELVCHSDNDTCHANGECEPSDQCYPSGDDNEWACTEQDCDIGRPLLVAGEARTAPAVRRDDWAAELAISVQGLSEAERALQSAHWLKVAALEHASVGSFARFTLQLLALGAPPELVLEAQLAAADEVRHARIAYGIASFFAGITMGPGPLPLDGAMPALDPAGVLCSLIDEACVGETIGAAEARSDAEAATGEISALLHGIADDESRHAALAWRTLKWILAEHPHLVTLAQTQFEATLARHRASANPVHRAAIRAVVEPLIRATVGQGPHRPVFGAAGLGGAPPVPNPTTLSALHQHL